MLSVQSPGYAGMGQRLGMPGGPGGGGGGPDRHHQCRDLNDISHLQNMASIQQVSREYNRLKEIHARTRSMHHSEVLNCPPRIALPDGEHGQDRQLQLRVGYQQAELTRSAIQPPPNKTVQDVPDWSPPPPVMRKSPTQNNNHNSSNNNNNSKKDSFMQKAVKFFVSKASFSGNAKGAETMSGTTTTMTTVVATAETGSAGTGGNSPPPPCVMVPLRPPPAPAPPPPAPPAPPSPPHASPS